MVSEETDTSGYESKRVKHLVMNPSTCVTICWELGSFKCEVEKQWSGKCLQVDGEGTQSGIVLIERQYGLNGAKDFLPHHSHYVILPLDCPITLTPQKPAEYNSYISSPLYVQCHLNSSTKTSVFHSILFHRTEYVRF